MKIEIIECCKYPNVIRYLLHIFGNPKYPSRIDHYAVYHIRNTSSRFGHICTKLIVGKQVSILRNSILPMDEQNPVKTINNFYKLLLLQ